MILRIFENLAGWTTKWAGSTWAFSLAVTTIGLWLISGPIFNYSDTWQLVINTSTTIVTFLMVFLLQRAHNKESLAMQMKLNELIASHKGASNHILNIEDLTEEEIRMVQIKFYKLAEIARQESDPLLSHSVEEINR